MVDLVGLTKKQIRSRILLSLKTQKEEDRDRKSKLIKRKLFRMRFFKKAKIVMFYVSFNGEVKTQDMIKEALKLGKIIAVPVCLKRCIIKPSLLRIKDRLVKGIYGAPEPAIKRFINLNKLDLVIVPGVAFDKRGRRLGRGKGFYDRFLSKLSHKTTSVGLAFNLQILPLVPTTKRDVSVDRVIFA